MITEMIPVIDLGPYLAGAPGAIDRTAEELRFALTEIGFYFIVNHGVPSGQIREVFRQVARFHAQSLEKKLEIKLDKHNVGYLPMKGDTLRTSTVETVTKPNLNEALFVARDLPSDHPDVLADRRFRSAAAALRPSSQPASTNFFTNHQGPLARALADQNTPPVARSWGYRMNMGMDVFESMFAKAKATRREALLAS